jgi:glycosyltransferase involved in cell wall biosynthesis
MTIVSTSYVSTPEFTEPTAWLKRIAPYTGILETLAKENKVYGIERINYEGACSFQDVEYRFINLKKRKVLFPFRMHRLIKSLNPDVVLVNGLIFPLQVIQLRWALGKKRKIVLLHRAEKPFKGIKKYLQRVADRCINAYLFSSLEFAGQWKKNINSKKIYEVIQASSFFFPADKKAARATLNITGSPTFLWVGRLNANKDPVAVVKAFLSFLDDEPLACLYMIYQTEELLPAIKELIKGKEASVILAGSISHTELQQWYNSSDYIISGSHYEGSGIGICEAMSCGCIPIVTNIASFTAMLGYGECGITYMPGNTDDLLKAMRIIIQRNKEEEKQKVLMQFSKELSFDAIARKIKGIIAKV